MVPFKATVALAMALFMGGGQALAQEREDFNKFIEKSVDKLAKERARKGYDITKYFTESLKYGDKCCIKSNAPPRTMCVAAVAETIVEALNIYQAESSDTSPFQALPLASWTGGRKDQIRPHIFMYEGMGSKGTATALRRFGIGQEIAFENLRAFDFVNFDRKAGSGHAAVFLAYLDKDGNELPEFSDGVTGFKYFSAQGKGKPDAGFWYRWAYFSDKGCPDFVEGKPRDCGVLRRSVHAGRMWHPKSWQAQNATDNLMRDLVAYQRLSQRGAAPSERTVTKEVAARQKSLKKQLKQTLPHRSLRRFSGETTD